MMPISCGLRRGARRLFQFRRLVRHKRLKHLDPPRLAEDASNQPVADRDRDAILQLKYSAKRPRSPSDQRGAIATRLLVFAESLFAQPAAPQAVRQNDRVFKR